MGASEQGRTAGFDKAKAEAFGERMVEMLNMGALAVMTSIGHRTGLFDALSKLTRATSSQAADAAGLSERYVREWLNAMVTARVIDYDPGSRTYSLPAEHAAALTRDAAPDNLAAFAQYIPMMGSVEDDIVGCFREGGGVPYQKFHRFHEVMAEDSGQTVLPALIDAILPLAPGLTERLEQGVDVLDVGCGAGRALNLMAVSYPNSRFTGYDLSPEAIAMGEAETRENGVGNLKFVARDVTELGEEACYDLITTFDAVHDQADPAAVLSGIARALRDDGVYLMQDIGASSHVEKNLDHPMGTLLYTISTTHCMTVSLARDGVGLGAMWGRETAQRMLRDAGFGSVSLNRLEHDVLNEYYVCTK